MEKTGPVLGLCLYRPQDQTSIRSHMVASLGTQYDAADSFRPKLCGEGETSNVFGVLAFVLNYSEEKKCVTCAAPTKTKRTVHMY